MTKLEKQLLSALASAQAKKLVWLLREAVNYHAMDWATDNPISGSDLVAFFADWRQRVKKVLK